MTKQSHRWVCEEKNTGARDGFYTYRADAEAQCGYKEAIWPGSSWIFRPPFRGETLVEGYHSEEPMRSSLITHYGEPDYKAGDEWCEAFEEA